MSEQERKQEGRLFRPLAAGGVPKLETALSNLWAHPTFSLDSSLFLNYFPLHPALSSKLHLSHEMSMHYPWSDHITFETERDIINFCAWKRYINWDPSGPDRTTGHLHMHHPCSCNTNWEPQNLFDVECFHFFFVLFGFYILWIYALFCQLCF